MTTLQAWIGRTVVTKWGDRGQIRSYVSDTGIVAVRPTAKIDGTRLTNYFHVDDLKIVEDNINVN